MPDSRDSRPPDGEPPASSTSTDRPTTSLRPQPAVSSRPGPLRGVTRVLESQGFEERYELRRLLGRGGIGEVHLCHDRHIGRDVALKRIHREGPAAGASGTAARFVREARVQGQLEHPSVVPVYDLGVTPDGVEFFTMKRIGGMTLEEIVRRLRDGDERALGEYPRNKRLQIFRQICLAMDYAHVRGVVHRDLKPANIMVGRFGEVYVLDWGIAKVLPGEGATIRTGVPHEDRTVDGQILGTVGYMPPEQLVGDSHVGTPADVYALGAILYELLTLGPLHQGRTSAELMRSTQIGADARASVRAPDRNVPPELERLCVEATALEATDRPQGARALAERIEGFLEGDRDVALRGRLAEAHTGAAEEAAREAFAGGAEAEAHRRRALQEAGRALALDPTSTAATRLLMRLMLQPPAAPPPAARRAIEDEEMEEARVALRFGGAAYLGVGILAAAAMAAAGIRSMAGLAAIVVPVVFGGCVAWLLTRRPRITPGQSAVVVTAGFVAISAAAGIGGPLLFVPGLAAANVMATSVGLARPYRGIILLLACLALTVPFALDWWGVIPPAYVYRDGAMVLLPRVTAIPPWIEPVAIVAALVGIVIAPSFVIWRIGDRLAEMRARVHTQHWQLQQLVPGDAAAPGA
jgi:eukaryotic-like serine/threonine-protein kinase